MARGAEFVRWEVATAIAGALLEINPFDEPNVQQAKDATKALLKRYAADGSLPCKELGLRLVPEGRMLRLPTRADVDPRIHDIQENLIIEVSSR